MTVRNARCNDKDKRGLYKELQNNNNNNINNNNNNATIASHNTDYCKILCMVL